jgi:hypothetical protein
VLAQGTLGLVSITEPTVDGVVLELVVTVAEINRDFSDSFSGLSPCTDFGSALIETCGAA